MNKWKLEEYNGWNNWYTWACYLWISNKNEGIYEYFNEVAKNEDLESFKLCIEAFVLTGGVVDFEEEDYKLALENIDYKTMYKSLRNN